MTVSTFESELKEYYEQKRRTHLINRIGKATELMRETLLLCTVFNEVFDESLSPGTTTQSDVETLQEHVQNGEFDQIAEKLDQTLADLETERDDIRETLQVALHEIEDRINGFESLNNRIKEIDEERIENLYQTAQTVDDVMTGQIEDFQQRQGEIRRNASSFNGELEAVEGALFQGFRGSDIEEIVRSLLQGDTLHITAPDDEEVLALQESQLGPYVNLSLEGE